jgi:hypothetical protein
MVLPIITGEPMIKEYTNAAGTNLSMSTRTWAKDKGRPESCSVAILQAPRATIKIGAQQAKNDPKTKISWRLYVIDRQSMTGSD